MTHSIPDMGSWSILDFELALDGIRQVSDATIWLHTQPRATSERRGRCHPGADFIVELGEQWCCAVIDTLIGTLESRRFSDPDDEDRRLKLLLHHHTSYGAAGEPLPRVMALLETWRAPLS